MATVACILRSGGDYNARHVQWLAKQVPGLVCVADQHIPGVKTVPMPNKWPGWWSKMNLWDPLCIQDDIFFIDLDTVVVGDVQELIGAANGNTTMLSDFYWPEKAASGLMYISHKDKLAVYEEWYKDTKKHMQAPRSRGVIGDQGFLGKVLTNVQRWQDVAPGKVVSYKVHCKKGFPKDASVVCFHGKPRPWDSRQPWVPKL